MQVRSVEVDTLFVPVARPYSAGGRQVTGNWHVLARLTTSDGVQGHGYIVALRQGLVAAVAEATRELGSQLVGMHVLEVEAAWERLASAGYWVGPGGLLHYAIAPLDIALWDAAGKTLGQRNTKEFVCLCGGCRVGKIVSMAVTTAAKIEPGMGVLMHEQRVVTADIATASKVFRRASEGVP